jgi:hypothetical protein
MPIAGTANAPTFDGKNVSQFLKILQQHGRNAQLEDDDLLSYIIPYCTDDVQRVLRYSDEVEGTTATWKSASEFLVELYGAEDKTTPKKHEFDAFIAQGRTRKDFKNRAELDRYHREFRTLAGPLRQAKKLTDNEVNLKFFEGLPNGLRQYYVQNAVEAHRTTDSAAPISQVIKTVSNLYNPNRIEWYTLSERGGKEDETDTDNELSGSATMVPLFTNIPAAQVSDPTNATGTNTSSSKDKAIEDLSQQLQQLSLNQAQLQQLLTNVLTANPSGSSVARSGNQVCFICGKPGTHRLHPRYCPETAKLLTEQLVKFDIEQNRFVLPNGDNLPQVPFSDGGVAKYLRDNRARILALAANRDVPPHITAKTSTVSLMLGSDHVFQGDVFALAANELDDDIHVYEDYTFGHFDSHPVTRSGRDTSSRHNPIQRPSAKPKSNEPNEPRRTQGAPTPPTPVSTKPTAPSPNPQQRTPAATTIPPPHPMNTREGYKDYQRSKKDQDVEMKDSKDESRQRYHFTSDIQDQVSLQAVEKKIMDTLVTVSLRDIIGVSPPLQKRFTDATKTRREYVTKSGEYELYTPEAEKLLADSRDPQHIEPSQVLEVNDDIDELNSFLIRYSNAVHFKPTKKYAMTTGVFKAQLGGATAICLVDCGSELNIFPERMLERTGLALDLEGSRWSLKGVNGGPVALRGVCKDVPLLIGGHNFDHHFFVTREDMESHDCILGQPWIQWFAARIDYHRSGAMKMLLWKDGDRCVPPTLSLSLTKADDPRNVDNLGPAPPRPPKDTNQVRSAYVEDADSDF